MDADIEQVVRACDTCQSTRSLPAVAPLHPWEWPPQPRSADFAGPFQGHMFLIVVDACTKWLEVHTFNEVNHII